MSTVTSPTARFPWIRWLFATLVTLGASVLVNLGVRWLLLTLFEIPADFESFTILRIAFLTTMGVIGAALVYAFIMARYKWDGLRIYRLVAVIALVLSFIPDIVFAVNPDLAPVPGGTALAWLLLMIFHVTTFIMCVTLLPAVTSNPYGYDR